jgi:hypothetical protein
MDDADAARIRTLVPRARCERVPADRVIRYFEPERFVR